MKKIMLCKPSTYLPGLPYFKPTEALLQGHSIYYISNSFAIPTLRILIKVFIL